MLPGIRESAPLLFIQHLNTVASLREACGRSWLALSLPLSRETIPFCHVLSINIVIGYQLGMCALLFYNPPPPLDPLIGMRMRVLGLIALRAHL